ncbi:MAG: ABC transporter permease [Dehalococcoidia bacterium]|nr:ABC transporter permease [Dehalococcoidia bacterium]MCB9484161.1 ABC transporter permease [Dehalococcoidia bacterium]MCB9491159.1 ABC transporter permease [Dehalococcoidia bacterium]
MNEATIAAIVAAATPLVFAAIGETITEKAGIVNLSLDGSMLMSAMTGFAIAVTTGSVELGFLAAAAVSMALALIVAFSGIEFRLNQIAIGIVLTLLGTKLSAFLGQDFVRRPGPAVQRMSIPVLEDIPFVGPVFFDHNPVVYASFLLIGVSFWFMFHTRAGLELQAVGERPEAAFARGIPVNRLRYAYAALGGALVGVGGAAFSLDVKFGWSEGHIANFGWIALAIVIFGGWHPVRAALGCYLFGFLQIAALKLQPDLPDFSQVLPILPFPLMILTLVAINHPVMRRLGARSEILGRLVRGDPPSALGRPFWRE